MSEAKIYQKRKNDAKTAIMTLYKKQKEERNILQQMTKAKLSTEELDEMNSKLKLV